MLIQLKNFTFEISKFLFSFKAQNAIKMKGQYTDTKHRTVTI